MITFPNCKINLGLRIIRKRTDGYHDLETCFYPIAFTDILEIIHSTAPSVNFNQTGLPVTDDADNLCIRAYQLLKKEFPSIGGIHMHLHKVIPLGSGLGGGSADGAFTIKMMNELFALKLTIDQMQLYASRLGSDCAFFIANKPSVAAGRGEILSPVDVDLSRYKIVLVNPGIMISSAWAFSKILPATSSIPIREILKQPVHKWKQELFNDFEVPVFREYPEIKRIKAGLYTQGALYASLSGSGSTVFGIFEKEHSVDRSGWDTYFSRTVS